MKQKKEPFKIGEIIHTEEGEKYKIFGLCEGLMAVQKVINDNAGFKPYWSKSLEWRVRTKKGWLQRLK